MIVAGTPRSYVCARHGSSTSLRKAADGGKERWCWQTGTLGVIYFLAREGRQEQIHAVGVTGGGASYESKWLNMLDN